MKKAYILFTFLKPNCLLTLWGTGIPFVPIGHDVPGGRGVLKSSNNHITFNNTFDMRVNGKLEMLSSLNGNLEMMSSLNGNLR